MGPLVGSRVGGDSNPRAPERRRRHVLPDGTTIAYEGPRGLWLAGTDGSQGRLLVEGNKAVTPSWSPDGSKVAYEDSGRVRVVEVATGKVSEIVDGSWPEWFDNDTLIVGP